MTEIDSFKFVMALRAFLPEDKDQLNLVIKGHLLMDAGIDGMITKVVAVPDKYDKSMYTAKKLEILQMLWPSKYIEHLLPALKAFNLLRNAFAHKLIWDEGKMDSHWGIIISNVKILNNKYEETDDFYANLRNAIIVICMKLDVLGNGIGNLLDNKDRGK